MVLILMGQERGKSQSQRPQRGGKEHPALGGLITRLKTRKTILSSTYDNKHTLEMNHSESRLPVSGQGSGVLVQGQPQPLLN